MTTVTFILKDGSRRRLDASGEANLMQLATSNNLPGIEGACGGYTSCATCHVYVESGPALPPVTADEDKMLGGTASRRGRNSRLACQILVSPQIDGLVVRIPDSQ